MPSHEKKQQKTKKKRGYPRQDRLTLFSHGKTAVAMTTESTLCNTPSLSINVLDLNIHPTVANSEQHNLLFYSRVKTEARGHDTPMSEKSYWGED